ncbi:MAG: hypothetical protein AAF224_14850 [Pseudomonadota bacterium]
MNITIATDYLYKAMPALSILKAEATRCIKRTCRRIGAVDFIPSDEIIVVKEGEIESVKSLILEALTSIGRRPYTSREVRDILRITNKERLRWTKDGRLTRGGNEIINRGQKIAVVTYDTWAIEDLAAKPERLAEWRSRDKISNDNT